MAPYVNGHVETKFAVAIDEIHPIHLAAYSIEPGGIHAEFLGRAQRGGVAIVFCCSMAM
jgi:hypothetical protein